MRNPLTIEAFADWCEKKTADEKYDYCAACECAAAQFLRDNGFPSARCTSGLWREHHNTEEYHKIDDDIEKAVIAGPSTFGALAARLRAIPA